MQQIIRLLCRILFYSFGNYLSNFYCPVIGEIANQVRIFLYKIRFKKVGGIDAINRRVYWGIRKDVGVGNYSDIGEM